MSYRVKNWKKFQVFKDRNPPWVRLYRDLLDDPDWHDVDGDDAKTLVMLWLIASEDEAMEGKLPCPRKLAFRLRISEIKLIQCLKRLSHWLYQDDIKTISEGYQSDAPETETETETDIYPSKKWPENFREQFWNAYPRKVGKGLAIRKLEAIRASGEIEFNQLIAAIGQIEASEEKFIPHPATWLNQGRYLDNATTGPPAPFQPKPTDGLPSREELRARYAQERNQTGNAGQPTAPSEDVLDDGLRFSETASNGLDLD